MKAVVQTEGLPPGQQLYRFYYPFNPLVLIPSTIYFWKQKNKITGGSSDRIPIANMAPQCHGGGVREQPQCHRYSILLRGSQVNKWAEEILPFPVKLEDD